MTNFTETPVLDQPTTTQRRRIALVIHALFGGGAERLMSQLAARWSGHGHAVHLITLADVSTDQYTVPQEIVRHGLSLLTTSRSPWSALHANWQRVTRLSRLLHQLQPDTVISFCDRMNIVAITAALRLPAPLWIAEHSNPARQHLGLFWETWRQWSYRRLARRDRSGCVALTPPIADYLQRRFPGLTVEVIPPAIELYHSVNTVTQGESSLQRRLLFIGRHSPEKNLGELIEAWRVLSPEFTQWRLMVAGDGPEHQQLRDKVERLGVQRVDLPGWVAEPGRLLADSQLFVLPSLYEGFPVALLEALQAGVACVSTPNSWATEQLALAGAVELSADMTAQSIAVKLAQVMQDELLRQRLATRGQAAAQVYSWSVIGPKWDQLLDRNPIW